VSASILTRSTSAKCYNQPLKSFGRTKSNYIPFPFCESVSVEAGVAIGTRYFSSAVVFQLDHFGCYCKEVKT
jgi:hypothetical protein